jgi:hypothetical protein
MGENVRSVSEPTTHLLGQLRHPVRLPILVALEQRPLSPAEMAVELGEPFDRVNHAMRALAQAGLIEPVERDLGPDAPNLLRRVYGPCFHGWEQLIEALEAIAATGDLE